jgi:hypothetical protein
MSAGGAQALKARIEMVVMTRNLMHGNGVMMLANDRSVNYIYQNEFIDKYERCA